MVVSLHKNLTIKDTTDSFVRVMNNNFKEVYDYLSSSTEHTLPATYQQVEWIASDGNQYIDTGINTYSSTSTITKWEGKSGYKSGSSNRRFLVAYDNPNYSHYAEFNASNQYGTFGDYIEISTSSNTLYNCTMQINGSSSTDYTININGEEYSKTTTQYQSSNMGNFVLFRLTSSYTGSGIMIGTNKIYIDGVLTRNYVPCYRVSDSVIGMYDLVNGVFYTNNGTGTFTKGDDVETPICLYDLLRSLSVLVTIGYKNLPTNATMKWFVNGISTTSKTVNTNTGSWVSYKLTTTSGVRVEDFVATESTYIDLSGLTPNTKVLTISPTQSGTTVEINVSGSNPYEFEQSGNTISVSPYTIVTYKVSKDGYDTVEETIMITDNQTISVTCPEKKYDLTINPTPEDATVTLTASGYTQSGNTIRVPSGTVVQWSVSKDGYATKSGSETITADTIKSVEIIERVTLTITPTPSNATVTMAAPGYSQSGHTITVGNGTTVTWMVSCDGYYPQSGNYVVTKDYEMKVKLTGV